MDLKLTFSTKKFLKKGRTSFNIIIQELQTNTEQLKNALRHPSNFRDLGSGYDLAHCSYNKEIQKNLEGPGHS